MDKQNPELKSSTVESMKRSALVSVSAGCLTMLMAGMALLVGLLIDSRLGTAPKWTLILVIGSAPFTFGGVYLIVRRSLKPNRKERQRIEEEGQEEDKNLE